MVRLKNFTGYPIEARPLGEKKAKKPPPINYKTECEIRLCCNCTNSFCNGNPCAELKEAWAEAKNKIKNSGGKKIEEHKERNS